METELEQVLNDTFEAPIEGISIEQPADPVIIDEIPQMEPLEEPLVAPETFTQGHFDIHYSKNRFLIIL